MWPEAKHGAWAGLRSAPHTPPSAWMALVSTECVAAGTGREAGRAADRHASPGKVGKGLMCCHTHLLSGVEKGGWQGHWRPVPLLLCASAALQVRTGGSGKAKGCLVLVPKS